MARNASSSLRMALRIGCTAKRSPQVLRIESQQRAGPVWDLDHSRQHHGSDRQQRITHRGAAEPSIGGSRA